MKQVQRGFTLIELVMVIVIIGILAAVAMPKFVNLSSQANTAALAGVAGALASASAINYASSKVTNGPPVVNDCVGVGDLLAGGLPADYSITGEFPACTVSKGGLDKSWTGSN